MTSTLQEVRDATSKEVTKVRWALGLSGLLSIAFGVVILVWPGISLYALVILFGAYALVRGAFGLGTAFTMSDKTNRGWLILSSLAGIVVGVVALLWTGMSALALVYVIGAYAITLGIISLGGAFWLPLPNDGRLVLSLIGLASILVGIAMIAEPGAGALALLALIAAFALTIGSFELVAAVGGERLLKRRARAFMEAHEPQTGATATPSPSH